MIAMRDNLPVVRFPDGRIMNFERSWLSTALMRAADRSGYKKWWLAPHVVESVTNYFEQDFPEPCISIKGLEKAVRSVLQVIGYSDVAEQFRVGPPPARISLEDVARDAGCGYELMFFDLLKGRLQEAIEAKAERLELYNAHRGVKMLRSAKNWRRDCSGLLDEIVTFVRGELDARKEGHELEMQLS